MKILLKSKIKHCKPNKKKFLNKLSQNNFWYILNIFSCKTTN